jgi:protein TonB
MIILVRYFYSNVGAILVTFGLFLIMQHLITRGSQLPHESPHYQMVDFIRTDQSTELQTRIQKPPRPPESSEQPPSPDLAAVNTDQPEPGLMSAPRLSFTPNFQFDAGHGLGFGDGELLPIVQIAPEYPRKALKSRVEGYVIVEFTVDTDGKAIAPRILEAQPSGVFDAVSLEAITRYRFRPRTINGQAVQVPGQRKRFNFRIN